MIADELPNIFSNLGSTQFDPLLNTGLVVLSLGYLLCVYVVTKKRGISWPLYRTLCFLASMAVTAVALDSVIGVYDDVLFYDHMIQHIMLIMGTAPLLALSAPIRLLVEALGPPARHIVDRAEDMLPFKILFHPFFAYALYAFVTVAFHLTFFYQEALKNENIHKLEHLGFIVAGYLFYRPVVGLEYRKTVPTLPARILYLIAAIPVDTFVGVALLTTNHELFSYYYGIKRSWGPSLVDDLRAGGAVMWIGGDGLMMVALGVLVARFIKEQTARELAAEEEDENPQELIELYPPYSRKGP